MEHILHRLTAQYSIGYNHSVLMGLICRIPLIQWSISTIEAFFKSILQEQHRRYLYSMVGSSPDAEAIIGIQSSLQQGGLLRLLVASL